MKYIVLLTLCLSLFIFLRSLTFALTYLSLYGYREKECIERIRQQQKACDRLNASYHIFMMIVAACLSAAIILRKSDVDFLQTFEIASLAVVGICYTLFFVVRYRLEVKYDLRNFYNHMINNRLHQKVVTNENDYEVSFIRSYEKTTKHKLLVNLYSLVYIICLFL